MIWLLPRSLWVGGITSREKKTFIGCGQINMNIVFCISDIEISRHGQEVREVGFRSP